MQPEIYDEEASTAPFNIVYDYANEENNTHVVSTQPIHNEVDNYELSSFKEKVDDYDYESPYWCPSNEEKELMAQFKKLRIRIISGRELE